MQAEISKQKAALQKQAVVVKTQHKEHQTAVLELGREAFEYLILLANDF
jgi:hypothetical protein